MVESAQFRTTDSLVRWEMHYSITEDPTRTIFKGDLRGTEVYMRVIIRGNDTVSVEWIAEAWRNATGTEDPYSTHHLNGFKAFLLSPGLYSIEIYAVDLHDSTNFVQSNLPLTIKPFPATPSLSDILFILRDRGVENLDPMYTRSGLVIEPNPRKEYAGTDPAVSFYIEMYNTANCNYDSLLLEYVVQDAVMREIVVMYRQFPVSVDGLVERAEFPVAFIPSGVYFFTINLISTNKETIFSTRRNRFYVLNPDMPVEAVAQLSEDEQFEKSEWATITGTRLKQELEYSKLLADISEKVMLKELTTERAKQKYLYRFWRDRNPEPESNYNSRLLQFRNTIALANDWFSSPLTKEGWRTDRGYVLAKHGPPTERVQFVETMETLPYEKWFYQNIQGGVWFIFVDALRSNNHQLIHSTMIGQPQNANWFEERVKVNRTDPNPVNKLLPQAR